MMFLKACPKCRGDISIQRDQHGQFVQCLQCGLLGDVPKSRTAWRWDENMSPLGFTGA
jgi:hypothetical protein